MADAMAAAIAADAVPIFYGPNMELLGFLSRQQSSQFEDFDQVAENLIVPMFNQNMDYVIEFQVHLDPQTIASQYYSLQRNFTDTVNIALSRVLIAPREEENGANIHGEIAESVAENYLNGDGEIEVGGGGGGGGGGGRGGGGGGGEREMCARTVCCTNIDKKVTEAEIKGFFEIICGEVRRLRMLGDDHRSTRFCLVEFDRAESAVATLSCSGVVLGASAIRVSPSKTPVRMRALIKPMT